MISENIFPRNFDIEEKTVFEVRLRAICSVRNKDIYSVLIQNIQYNSFLSKFAEAIEIRKHKYPFCV